MVLLHGEHGNVDLAELFGLDRSANHRIDFVIAGPDILEADFPPIRCHTQHILLDIETDRTRDGVGHDQGWGRQKCLFGIRVNTAIEVSVTRQHRGGVQVPVDDFLLDGRVEGAGHAIAGGASKSDDAEAQRFELRLQARLFQVQLYSPGSRSKR